MHRRKFLAAAALAVIGVMAVLSLQFSLKRKIKDFIKSILHFLNPTFHLPEKGKHTSVEMALNSRCNSDYDDNPQKDHWGMFDTTKKLSDAQIQRIIHLARIPRFTGQRVEIQSEGSILTFVIDNHATGLQRDWMMVESGMQQQATALVCAALGVGMVFRNLGHDGMAVSTMEYATTKIKLNPMKPSYGDSFWTSSAPTGRKPWLVGNLPDPLRNGNKTLISALDGVQVADNTGKTATDEAISQLLWAARGRTPHYYLSRPWGMTIPTAQGKQDISCLYMISGNKLSRYVNWQRNRPTSSLEFLIDIQVDLHNELSKSFQSNNCFFIIGRNEALGTAFWEVGYQLLNLLLQAHALGVAYHAALFDETHKTMLRRMPIEDPVAILALKRQSTGA